MKTLIRYAIAAALTLPLGAQAPAGEGTITRQQADDILTELRQIRQLLEKQQTKDAAPEPEKPVYAKLNLKGFEMLGDKNAPLTMVEFTDYQCPFCQRFHTAVFSELKKQYIDTGKVRYYSRDLPLDFHPNAMRAAQAGRCASDQKHFWEMRNIMAANPDKLDMTNLLAVAVSLKMDVNAFRECVESGKYKSAVQADIMEAMKIGANGTPTFVVGKSTADGVDGELVVGAMPLSEFEVRFTEYGTKK